MAVFAEGATADEARAAGADVVGGVELVEGILNGNLLINSPQHGDNLALKSVCEEKGEN